METLLTGVTAYIGVWGYWAIFWGIALGNANIPIPSEIVLGFTGYLVYAGQLDFARSVAVATAGGVAGSVVSYLVGLYGGMPFVHRYGRYVLLSESKLRLAERWMERYGLHVAFFGRLVPVVRAFVSLPAGFARMNFARFLLYTVAGSFIWAIGLIWLGIIFGENWRQLRNYIDTAAAVLAVAIAGWFIFRRHRARSVG